MKDNNLPTPPFIFLSSIFLSKRKLLGLTPAAAWIPCFLVLASLSGCGKSTGQTAHPPPFKTAIAEYLERGNMAMALKEIKEGPTVSGNTATMKASLVHAQMPGPAVTWVFHFEKGPDGKWKVVNHES